MGAMVLSKVLGERAEVIDQRCEEALDFEGLSLERPTHGEKTKT
jgi:hypothetical protein